jgi:hypothetical protein
LKIGVNLHAIFLEDSLGTITRPCAVNSARMGQVCQNLVQLVVILL